MSLAAPPSYECPHCGNCWSHGPAAQAPSVEVTCGRCAAAFRAGREEGAAEMARAFWAEVTSARARTAEKKARACARSAGDVRASEAKHSAEVGVDIAVSTYSGIADWHQARADEHFGEAAQLRAWARE